VWARWRAEEVVVADVIWVLLIVVCFALARLFVRVCERLQ